METIRFLDTTLRDGEQTAGVRFDASAKVEIANQLARMGLDVIEAGFPAASTAELDAVSAVAHEVRGAQIAALARAVPADVEVAAKALESADSARIHVFVSSSNLHRHVQLHKELSEVAQMAGAAVRQARQYCDEVEFSPMDATRSTLGDLAMLVRAALQAGATVINLPDTVGIALPHQVSQLFRNLRAEVPELRTAILSFHGQNDLGMASANALAALQAGATQLEVTANGIGERAGNTALEEVVLALRVHARDLGCQSRIRSEGIHKLSQLVEKHSGIPIAPNKAVVGANAFRHASGIHQDGVVQNRESYESIDPAWIGHPMGSEIVLGKLSGRAGFAARIRALGFSMHDAAFETAFARFQTIADQCAEVNDSMLRSICSGARTP